MKYVAAYLLATLGGDSSPSPVKIESILKSGGLEVDPKLASQVVDSLKGKDVNELIAAGQSKLAVMTGGGGVAVASAATTEAAAPAAETKKAPAKEEKKEESDDDDMGFGLFD